MCVCERERGRTERHSITEAVCIPECVTARLCVCVCVCEARHVIAAEVERESDRRRERKRERRVCVLRYVCVCV